MKVPKSLIAVAMAAGAAGMAAPATGAEVTFQRLLNAQDEPQNWLLPYGNYSSHSHSSLNQINRTNVRNLQVKFLHSVGGMNTATATGTPPVQEATPAVKDGYMYVHNAWGQVQKVDVRSGTRARTLWINDPKQEKAGSYSRGTRALLGNYVYNNTSSDMRLIKIDDNSGETVWEINTSAPPPHPQNQVSTAAALALKNQILVPQSNGGGRRGWLAAFSADDGREMWRFYSTPAPGEFGHETWKDTWNAWSMGGGGVWTTPSYDPDNNMVIYGTGDIIPWGDPTFRPGDNLFAVTTLALNADTGKLAWYFQQVPNDTFDGDNVSPKMLYDIPGADGKMRAVMGNFTRLGFYTTLDRANGAFINSEPYTFVNWTKGIDPKTGKPLEYDPNKVIQMYAKSIVIGDPAHSANTCPNFSGGPTYFPPTFDVGRMIVYAMYSDGCYSQENEKVAEKVDQRGRGPGNLSKSRLDAQPIGRIVAVDVRTGKKVRQNGFEFPGGSGLLGTAGDLIFMGHVNGMFTAYDKDTLAEVWSFDTGAPVRAAPITYAVDGKQYIAVVGGGARTTSPFDPSLALLQQNSQVIVFGL